MIKKKDNIVHKQLTFKHHIKKQALFVHSRTANRKKIIFVWVVFFHKTFQPTV